MLSHVTYRAATRACRLLHFFTIALEEDQLPVIALKPLH